MAEREIEFKRRRDELKNADSNVGNSGAQAGSSPMWFPIDLITAQVTNRFYAVATVGETQSGKTVLSTVGVSPLGFGRSTTISTPYAYIAPNKQQLPWAEYGAAVKQLDQLRRGTLTSFSRTRAGGCQLRAGIFKEQNEAGTRVLAFYDMPGEDLMQDYYPPISDMSQFAQALLVAKIARGLVEKWGAELGDLRTGTAADAPALVDLAITLHRLGPETREAGTSLFEDLLVVSTYTARDTLDQIDNRFRNSAPRARQRLPHRARRSPRRLPKSA